MKVASWSVFEKLFLPLKILLYSAYLLCFSIKSLIDSVYFWSLLFLLPFPYTKSRPSFSLISVSLSFTANAYSIEIFSSGTLKLKSSSEFMFNNISWVLFCNFSSNLSVAFFQTKLYLLAFASIFVPSTNKFSNSISFRFYNSIINCENKSSTHSSNFLLLNLAIVLWLGSFCPCKSQRKLISLLQAFSSFLLEYIPSI